MADRWIRKAPAEFHNTIKMTEANSALTYKKKVDNTTLNTGSGVTHTLTAAESGTHFNVDGTGNIVVNMPALSTSNVGLHYSFLVTTAVGGATTVKFVLPGAGVSNFFIDRIDYATASYPRLATSGDELTIGSASVAGSRVELLCVADDGSASTWIGMAASDVEPTLG